MRWTVLIALACLASGAPALAQTTNAPSTNAPSSNQPPPRRVKVQTHLPNPTAEPENPEAYTAPAHEKPIQTDADIGPVLKKFVRASTLDDPNIPPPIEDNAALAVHHKIALDKNISFPLVHDIENSPSFPVGSDDSLDAERKYLNWGAITQAQLKAREGQYFTVTAKNKGPKGDYTVLFEYRQVKSKDIVRTLSHKLPDFSGTTRAYFAVVSTAYTTYGSVSAWRLTIRKGDTVVAETKSFVW